MTIRSPQIASHTLYKTKIPLYPPYERGYAFGTRDVPLVCTEPPIFFLSEPPTLTYGSKAVVTNDWHINEKSTEIKSTNF